MKKKLIKFKFEGGYEFTNQNDQWEGQQVGIAEETIFSYIYFMRFKKDKLNGMMLNIPLLKYYENEA